MGKYRICTTVRSPHHKHWPSSLTSYTGCSKADVLPRQSFFCPRSCRSQNKLQQHGKCKSTSRREGMKKWTSCNSSKGKVASNSRSAHLHQITFLIHQNMRGQMCVQLYRFHTPKTRFRYFSGSIPIITVELIPCYLMAIKIWLYT